MARQISIIIGETEFSGSTAPAKSQIEMLHIVAKNNLFSVLKEEGSDELTITTMMFMLPSELARLKELCIKGGNIVRTLDDVPVAENLFQDGIGGYHLLLAKLLRENVGNFWQLNAEPNQ